MNLTKILRDQNYDLIEGPVRNHKPLQLWLKTTLDDVDLYYSDISHAFHNNTVLEKVENPALNINSTQKNEYGFNLGITILEDTLKAIGLGAFEVSSKVKSGKKVSISYDNSKTIECPSGDIANHLTNADFKHNNPSLLKNANRNNIIVINGVMFAENLVAEIETDSALDADLIAKLNGIADGKLDFTASSQNQLKMVSSGLTHFPIAVKAYRIDFDKGEFKGLKLVTDTRTWF